MTWLRLWQVQWTDGKEKSPSLILLCHLGQGLQIQRGIPQPTRQDSCKRIASIVVSILYDSLRYYHIASYRGDIMIPDPPDEIGRGVNYPGLPLYSIDL
ncbi:hypothetical protein N7468_004471 [Penicillium chermesinum]|uniref:Uncharacterized protein n=1 Tax=Penicillium chermesinum TaxID=63820 RepID=A0A9W9P8N5_9EURO|nr:uncharacterized protein N7468_004471 [Penicillium chermesinum]KAJ5239852.1 hypothetical protein N7468_004471 [Penicillium chermesinum]